MTSLTQLRLVDDDGTGQEILRFDDSIGVTVTRFDPGFPEPRASLTSRPSQDGSNDTTRFYGPRSMTAELLMPSVGWYLVEDAIRGALYAASRFYLYVLRDGWTDERRALVRGVSFTPQAGVQSPTAQVQWVGVNGYLEEAATQVGLVPLFANDEGGNPTPYTLPLALAPGFSPGSSVVEVDGTVPTTPVVTIYGPCVNPVLTIGSGASAKTLAFNLTIADGNFLFVDFAARTALLNNDPALSQYGSLDFTRSTWWQLQPGEQFVAFRPASAGPGAQAVLSWRPRYL